MTDARSDRAATGDPADVELVLASGSPRRREILAALGLRFSVHVPEVDETLGPDESADAAARRLAIEKASTIEEDPRRLVVAADTIVVLDELLLGKPSDPAEARAMLGRLSGRGHDVVSGLAVRQGDRMRATTARTRVVFRALDAAEIDAYVATGESADKAGSYAIQGLGSALVERIDGDFYNVMGLPVPALLDLLRGIGWRYFYGELRRAEADQAPASTTDTGPGDLPGG